MNVVIAVIAVIVVIAMIVVIVVIVVIVDAKIKKCHSLTHLMSDNVTYWAVLDS